jgi:beta-1,4-mannosyl-glycoprotein beta-1,4-N-acetylglucosaminyltransferase
LKIFDCVPFFNEFELLRLRIACLEDLVDRFVVVEARQMHSGRPKPLYLSESSAADLLRHPKVVVRAVDLPAGESDWGRDQYQRDRIGDVLAELGAAPQDLILVSDADEIPARAAVERARAVLRGARERTILAFEQRLFYFRLNFELVWSRKLPWLGTVASLRCHAPSINGLRMTGRKLRGGHARGFDRGARVFQLPDGGWHFSYLGGDEALNQKLLAHREHGAKHRHAGPIQEIIRNRQSLYPRKGLDEVWAVVERAAVGLPEDAVAKANLGPLFESPHDSSSEILRRVREVAFSGRWSLGGLRIGTARRGRWPRLADH